MVDIAQLVERQVVALEAVGSSPTVHPISAMRFSFRGIAKR